MRVAVPERGRFGGGDGQECGGFAGVAAHGVRFCRDRDGDRAGATGESEAARVPFAAAAGVDQPVGIQQRGGGGGGGTSGALAGDRALAAGAGGDQFGEVTGDSAGKCGGRLCGEFSRVARVWGLFLGQCQLAEHAGFA